MPIYEYQAIGGTHCSLCMGRFEVRQGMNDEPLRICPECGAEVRRLFSRPFLVRSESFSEEEAFGGHGREEADDMGLDEGFADDDWD